MILIDIFSVKYFPLIIYPLIPKGIYIIPSIEYYLKHMTGIVDLFLSASKAFLSYKFPY